MNGFLVMIATSLDDVPVALFENRGQAFELAGTIGQGESDKISFDILERCPAEAFTTHVTEFVDGKPVKNTIVQDFDN